MNLFFNPIDIFFCKLFTSPKFTKNICHSSISWSAFGKLHCISFAFLAPTKFISFRVARLHAQFIDIYPKMQYRTFLGEIHRHTEKGPARTGPDLAPCLRTRFIAHNCWSSRAEISAKTSPTKLAAAIFPHLGGGGNCENRKRGENHFD